MDFTLSINTCSLDLLEMIAKTSEDSPMMQRVNDPIKTKLSSASNNVKSNGNFVRCFEIYSEHQGRLKQF